MPEETSQPSKGTNIEGDVNTQGGDFVGRDQIVEGDVVGGDKVGGSKVEVGSVSDSEHVHIAGGDINVLQRISNFFQVDTEQQRALRNRQNMLQLVWNTWVDGVLKKSLHNEVLIELGMETKPDAVEHPWDMVMQMLDKKPQQVPQGKTMLELFDQASNSLLLLGEPGSGKTTMVLELCRLAIAQANEDPMRPIPVVFNLSSWRPKQTITEWLVEELKEKYYVSLKVGKPWVEHDELLLLLDGLDEVKAEDREACVQAINAFRDEHTVQLAICSRKREYDSLKEHLKLHSALLIQPLTSEHVREYLQEASLGLCEVFVALEKDAAKRNATKERKFLNTPLFISILVLAYRNLPEKDLKVLTLSSDFRKNLFDDYIATMFKRRGDSSRYTSDKTTHWLSWLARAMGEYGRSIFFIENITPDILPVPKGRIQFIVSLISGLGAMLIVGLFVGRTSGLGTGLFSGLLIGFGVGLQLRSREDKPTESFHWSWDGAKKGLLEGLIAGLFGGLIGGLIFWLISDLNSGVFVGLGGLLCIILLYGFSGGLRGSTIEDRSSPGGGVKSSFKNWLVTGLILGLILGLFYWLFLGLFFGERAGLISSLISGLLIGLIVGLEYGGSFVLFHFLSRYLLYRSGNIPWDLIAFLDYATDRILLRKVGGGYIFIHRMLMEHFAEMDEERIKSLTQEISP